MWTRFNLAEMIRGSYPPPPRQISRDAGGGGVKDGGGGVRDGGGGVREDDYNDDGSLLHVNDVY